MGKGLGKIKGVARGSGRAGTKEKNWGAVKWKKTTRTGKHIHSLIALYSDY